MIQNKLQQHKLLVLGSNNGSVELVKYAKSKNIYTIVADYYENDRSAAKREADESWLISTADIDLLEKKCRESGVDAILSGAGDFNVNNALILNERLALRSYCSLDTWHYSIDKADFKAICKKCNAPIPTDYYVSAQMKDSEIEKIKFPVMVKPVDLAGNRGISYCYNKEDLINGIKLAKSLSSSDKIIIERMLHGEEWWSAYAIADGEIRLIALTAMYAQPGEPKNCYTITTTVSSNIKRFIEEVNPSIEKVLKTIGCHDGFVWVQLMLDEDGHFYILEMGYRFDGSMMFVPFKDVTGFDAVQMHVDYAVGLDTKNLLPESQTCGFAKCATGYMPWSNIGGKIAEIKGVNELKARKELNVVITRRVGDEIKPYQALGCITFSSENVDDMCDTIDFINNTLKFIDEKGTDMTIKYTNFEYLRQVYKESLID